MSRGRRVSVISLNPARRDLLGGRTTGLRYRLCVFLRVEGYIFGNALILMECGNRINESLERA